VTRDQLGRWVDTPTKWRVVRGRAGGGAGLRRYGRAGRSSVTRTKGAPGGAPFVLRDDPASTAGGGKLGACEIVQTGRSWPNGAPRRRMNVVVELIECLLERGVVADPRADLDKGTCWRLHEMSMSRNVGKVRVGTARCDDHHDCYCTGGDACGQAKLHWLPPKRAMWDRCGRLT